jgi:hypothetical protein
MVRESLARITDHFRSRITTAKRKSASKAPPRPARRNACPGAGTTPGLYLTLLVARRGLSAGGLGDTDVTRYFILGDAVDDQLQWAAFAALVEEDRFVNR